MDQNASSATPKWYQKNSPLTVLLMVLALLFLVGAIIFSVFTFSGGNRRNKITSEKYEAINVGMTYVEVKELIGEDGYLFTRYGNGNEEVRVYVWNTGNNSGSATITFQGGKVYGKNGRF